MILACLLAGIVTVSVGHSHPAVVAAARSQIEQLMHTTTIYLNPQAPAFCEELASRLPKGPQWQIYLVNSGSECVSG